ncbi:MAG TPA: transcription antitermination factor NusB [Rectinemataceae bacterium]|nr:transcription antitermination factor NusB [Rectinemataceae bacterium]
MASRRKARILAFQALYAWDAGGGAEWDLLSFPWLEEDKLSSLDDEVASFARLLIAGTLEKIGSVDEAIRSHLQNWAFERLKRVDLAVLRIGAYSLLFQADIPAQITIDEAIEIVKEYGSEDSYRFVNGVLDGIWKSIAAR